MGKTLVVLGAGQVGLPIVHHALKHTLPKVKDLKVILVSPNTDHFWNLASVRAVVPGQISDDQLFTPIEPQLRQYPKDSWEHITGRAELLDPDSKTVVVRSNVNGSERTISYDALVVATGTRTQEGMPWKNGDSTEETKQRLHAVQEQLAKAKTIVVAGGGSTGIETAGEIGFEYGKEKDIYLVYDKALPMNDKFMESMRRATVSELKKLNVKTIPSSKITGVEATPGAGEGAKTLEITGADGKKTTMKVDAYVPAIGTLPNTEFVPGALRDERGYVKQGEELRAPGYKNLFVVGDVGNLEESTSFLAEKQVVHVVKSIQTVLVNGQEAAVETYEPNKKTMIGITVGRSRATGQMGNWKVWSIMIWYLKGRYLGTDYCKEIAKGLRAGPSVKDW